MLFLIKIWGNVIPANDAMERYVGKSIHLENISYVVMLLGFYLFPFIIFHNINFMLDNLQMTPEQSIFLKELKTEILN